MPTTAYLLLGCAGLVPAIAFLWSARLYLRAPSHLQGGIATIPFLVGAAMAAPMLLAVALPGGQILAQLPRLTVALVGVLSLWLVLFALLLRVLPVRVGQRLAGLPAKQTPRQRRLSRWLLMLAGIQMGAAILTGLLYGGF